MQKLKFTAKQPLEQPAADVFFLKPDALSVLPARCFTMYLATEFSDEHLFSSQLPDEALLVDYVHTTNWQTKGIEPKKLLEETVAQQWQQVRKFLNSHQVNITALHKNELHNIEAMDDALDILLGVSHNFLTIASEFQHSLELARPMRIHKTLREKYDSFILLAHRVQALTPGAFSQQFLQVYNEDDTFFFHDGALEHLVRAGESLGEAFARHMASGRKHLAYALNEAYMGRSFQPIK